MAPEAAASPAAIARGPARVAFAFDFEAALDTFIGGQTLSDDGERHVKFEAHADAREGVADVVQAGRVERDAAQALGVKHDVELRRGGDLLDVLGAQRGLAAGAVGDHAAVDVAHDRAHVLVVQAQNRGAEERDAVGVLDECRLDVVEAAGVRIEVVLLDVGDNCHDGREAQKRAVVLVGFHDDHVAVAADGVGAEGRDLAAHDDRRLQTGVIRHHADHRGRRRFAVRARDADAFAHPHELAQHLGALDARDEAPLGLNGLGVLIRLDRRGVHHHVHVLHVFRLMPLVDRRTQRFQPRRRVALLEVRARDLKASGEEHLSDRRHADAADADHVDTAHASHLVAGAASGGGVGSGKIHSVSGGGDTTHGVPTGMARRQRPLAGARGR